MRKQITIVPVSELTTVRIVCLNNGCNGIVEMPVSRLKPPDNYTHDRFECPLCGNPFRGDMAAPSDRLSILTKALVDLQKATKIRVEFVIPDDESD